MSQIELLTEQLRKSAVSPSLLVARSRLYLQSGDLQSALTDAQDALRLDPSSKDVQSYLQSLVQSQNAPRIKESLDTLQQSSDQLQLKRETALNLAQQASDAAIKSQWTDDQVGQLLSLCMGANDDAQTLKHLYQTLFTLAGHLPDLVYKSLTMKQDYKTQFIQIKDEKISFLAIESLVKLLQGIQEEQEQNAHWQIMQMLISVILSQEPLIATRKHALQSLIKSLGSRVSEQMIHHPCLVQLLDSIGNGEKELQSLLGPFMIRLWETLESQSQTRLESLLVKTATGWIEKNTNAGKVNGYNLMTTLFQFQPSLSSNVLSNNGFLSSTMETLDMESDSVQLSFLHLLSAACLDKESRALMAVSCHGYLTALLKNSTFQGRDLAATILSKLKVEQSDSRNGSQEETKILEIVLDTLLKEQQDSTFYHASIEALILQSIQTSVKNELITDLKLIKRLFELLKTHVADKTVVYGIATVLANLCRFPKRLTKEEEQIQKLQAFSKSGSSPKETKTIDSDEEVQARGRVLLQSGIVPALVLVSKSEMSESTSETLSLIFLSLCTEVASRGLILQQGGLRALQMLVKSGTVKGIKDATQALAKLLISTDPTIAFKGNSAQEVVSPLIRLCQGDDGLCQFEALLALTNLASTGPEVRSRILQASGLKSIESLLFSDTTLVRRAATELLCNMMYEERVFERYVNPEHTQRLKLVIALADIEDFETRRAASGILAILSCTEQGCKAMGMHDRFSQVLKEMVKDSNAEILHRGLECLKNWVNQCPKESRRMLDEGVIRVVMETCQRRDMLGELAREIVMGLKQG